MARESSEIYTRHKTAGTYTYLINVFCLWLINNTHKTQHFKSSIWIRNSKSTDLTRPQAIYSMKIRLKTTLLLPLIEHGKATRASRNYVMGIMPFTAPHQTQR